MARELGVEGQGVYAAAGAFPTLWATFWLLGLDASHTWAIASGRATLGRIIGNSIFWVIVLSLIAVPSYLLGGRLLDPEKVGALLPVFRITALIVPLVLARYLLLSCFLGLGRIDQYNLLNVLSQLILLAVLVAVLWIGHGSTVAAVWAYGFSILLLVLLGTLWLLRRSRESDPIRMDKPLLGTSLSYGVRGYGGIVFTSFTYRFDQVLLPALSGIAQQGYYSIAVLLAEKLSHITASLQLVLFPRVSASTPEEANRITTVACRHALFWVGSAAVALVVLAKPLIRLMYGSEFLPALAPLLWLVPGIFLLSFSKILTVDLSGRNRRFPTTAATCVAFLVNLGLNLLWIPRHGMLGAAWSSSIAYTLQSALMIVFFVRITGVPVRKLLVPERGDVELYRRLAGRLRVRLGAKASSA